MSDEVTEEPAGAGDAATGRPVALPAHEVLGALLRRIRRTADLSQRQLADALGVARSTVARAETGERDMSVGLLARAAQLAGLELVLHDAGGRDVSGMSPDVVRDRAGRRFPAHLDPRHGDVWWWHGSERYSRERPQFTFDRDRRERDRRRAADGTPLDHRPPRPGDSLAERARARDEAARARRDARWAAWLVERRRVGFPDPLVLTCRCPPGCDDLLFPREAVPPRQQAVPHVDDCACRCDIA